jgi:hypothetical protein
MTGRKLGPPLGEGGVGLELPDVVRAGEVFDIVAADVEDPAAVTCDVQRIDKNGSHLIDRPYFGKHLIAGAVSQASLVARATLPKPGMYRVEVHRGAASAVSQVILAIESSASVAADQVDLGE